MALHTVQSGDLRITVADAGAELVGVEDILTGRQYLWHGDATYWGRRSPVLFPIVGSLKNKAYRYNGKTYAMGQHGFARDMDFEMISHDESSIWFRLSWSEATLEKYPFAFVLEIGYEVVGREVKVLWRVKNQDKKIMFFSIGAHPAFLCPGKAEEAFTDCYLQFDAKDQLIYNQLSDQGLIGSKGHELALDEAGRIKLTHELFDGDALVVEQSQASCISLCDGEGVPYVTVTFDAPLFGIWSSAKKQAPFVCIEPWYGRCDDEGFNGTLEQREYGQELRPEQEFEKSYTMRFC